MEDRKTLRTRIYIIASGLATHTAAIYAARAELKPILALRGLHVQKKPPRRQAPPPPPTSRTSRYSLKQFSWPITECSQSVSEPQSSRKRSTKSDLSATPFKISTDEKTVLADSVVARRLHFTGSEEYCNREPLAVIGGGDSAMEEANHLATYGSEVYVIHRGNTLRALKITQNIVRENLKIRVVWNSEVVEAYWDRRGSLAGVIVKNVIAGLVWDLKVWGLFLAVGHDPATEFLGGQLKLDVDGYVVTKQWTTETTVRGVFAAGDVQDKKYRQAITAALNP